MWSHSPDKTGAATLLMYNEWCRMCNSKAGRQWSDLGLSLHNDPWWSTQRMYVNVTQFYCFNIVLNPVINSCCQALKSEIVMDVSNFPSSAHQNHALAPTQKRHSFFTDSIMILAIDSDSTLLCKILPFCSTKRLAPLLLFMLSIVYCVYLLRWCK